MHGIQLRNFRHITTLEKGRCVYGKFYWLFGNILSHKLSADGESAVSGSDATNKADAANAANTSPAASNGSNDEQ